MRFTPTPLPLALAPLLALALTILLGPGCASGAAGSAPTDPERIWLTDRGFVQDPGGSWARGLPHPPAPTFARPEDADDHHSRIGFWRTLETEHFEVRSTLDGATTRSAAAAADAVFEDLTRLFGRAPLAPPTVLVLRSWVQYNAFAVAEPEIGRLHPDGRGLAAVHHAFLADQWLDERNRLEHVGAGVGYWDLGSPSGGLWGPLSVRHAAALAFVEALDPSPRAAARFRARVAEDRAAPFPAGPYWAEKRLPDWMRYGAASYVERFRLDPAADDPSAFRRWSEERLDALGGPVESAELLAFPLDPTRPAEAERLILSAGLEVARRVDRGALPLTATEE